MKPSCCVLIGELFTHQIKVLIQTVQLVVNIQYGMFFQGWLKLGHVVQNSTGHEEHGTFGNVAKQNSRPETKLMSKMGKSEATYWSSAARPSHTDAVCGCDGEQQQETSSSVKGPRQILFY